MKTIDLSPLKENDSEYKELYNKLKNSHRGDWDDSVHRSFVQYIIFVEQTAEEIHNINLSAQQIESNAESLNIENLAEQAQTLCSEAYSI